MKLGEYLIEQGGRLLAHAAAIVSLSLFLYLTGTKIDILIIVWLVWGIGLLVFFIEDCWRKNRHLKELQGIMAGLEQKYLFVECMPKPRTLYEKKLKNLLRQSGKSMIEEVSEAKRKQNEYKEYIENWVHEVKVPITTAQLMCNNHPFEESNQLAGQLAVIEENVERVLYYARMENLEKDFIIQSVALNEIVTKVIKKYKLQLILRGMRIETKDLDYQVYTDGKWVEFILGQLFSNALRYKSAEPFIEISAQEEDGQILLLIKDNGIGIPPHELPRVFDRGFTGSNGRNRGGSTGMGLYICKRLAEELQMDMAVASKEGEYTEIALRFPKKNLQK